MFGRRERLETKAPHELRTMRRAGLVVARALEAVSTAAQPGVTTLHLDEVARETILAAGARPSFPEVPGYRHTLCVSVNEAVVHGIPGGAVLRAGDLVSVDCGAIVDGWHGDAAVTLHVGGEAAADPSDVGLSRATRDALWDGIAAFRVGGYVGDIGTAVERSLRRSGLAAPGGPTDYGIVTEYEGHGIGRAMHMEPGVPNVGGTGRGPRVRSGAVVAIEPMVTLGSPHTHELADEWTVVTDDGSQAAHWEHSVAVTDSGTCVLTAFDGGAAQLAARNVPHLDLD